MKKLCGIFLIIAMMLSLLLSCSRANEMQNTGENGAIDNSNNEQETETTTEEIIQANLPDADFGGHEFVVLSRNDDWHHYPLHSRDIIAETETGDIINDAVYKRNTIVEEKYNVKIKMIGLPETTGDGEMGLNNSLAKAVKAGDEPYDLVMVHLTAIGAVASKLCNIIFAVLRDNKPYSPVIPKSS